MKAASLPASAAEHWIGAASGELRLPHCLECGHVWFPPSVHCPRCRSSALEWRKVSGRGVVVGWCQFHRAYFPSAPGLDVPYTVILVRLDEGPLLYSNPGGPAWLPSVGARVAATFTEAAPGQALVHFNPAPRP